MRSAVRRRIRMGAFTSSRADVGRLRWRSVLQQLAEQLREPARGEPLSRLLELGERPPAVLLHALGAELLDREGRREVERADPRQVDPLRLPVPALAEREHELARPDARARLEAAAHLLRELAAQGLLRRLAGIDRAAG